MATLHNNTYSRTIGCTPAEARYGNVRPSRSEFVSGAFAHIPRPINWPLEALPYGNQLAAFQQSVQVHLSMAKMTDATYKDGLRHMPAVYKRGDFVLQLVPLPMESTLPCWRGPFIVTGPSGDTTTGSWYNVCKIEHFKKEKTAGDSLESPFSVHVSALKKFDASRTTVAQLLARNLDDDYGVVLAVTHHRLPAAAGGEVEFLVTCATRQPPRSHRRQQARPWAW
jgi:hypothetical protein